MTTKLPSAEVVVDIGSLHLSDSGAVFGQIWLRTNAAVSGAFPEIGWTDFPVVVLSWWLRETDALMQGSSTTAECAFIDGPFHFSVNRAGDVDLHEMQAGGVVTIGQCRSPTSRDELWRSVHLAACVVLEACDTSRWSTVDIETLRAACRSRGSA